MKKEPKTFKEWLLKRYLHRDSPVGDLARDVARDPDFPDNGDFMDMYTHIHYAAHDSEAATVALMTAYSRWWYYCDEMWR